MAVETGNTFYKPVLDSKKHAIKFTRSGGEGFRQGVDAVNTASAKIYLTVPAGAVGNINIVATKTANPNS